jgi:hypothetical protein
LIGVVAGLVFVREVADQFLDTFESLGRDTGLSMAQAPIAYDTDDFTRQLHHLLSIFPRGDVLMGLFRDDGERAVGPDIFLAAPSARPLLAWNHPAAQLDYSLEPVLPSVTLAASTLGLAALSYRGVGKDSSVLGNMVSGEKI